MPPFSDRTSQTVAALGEVGLLRAMRGWLGQASPPPPCGMGDDCAVLKLRPGFILAKTDGVVLGRHFTRDTQPALAGAKLLKRNLSDIAAMGGTPRHALVHLLLARNTTTAWLEAFYRGLAKECLKYQVTLAGGGIAQGPNSVFAADLMLLGEAGPNVLTRTGARIGDSLYVTGELGGSILGKHLHFTPRLAEGQWLSRQTGVRGLIDVSDGLAKDLPELLPKNADAQIDPAALPISKAALKLGRGGKGVTIQHALTDGEDYELLFALSTRETPASFERLWRKTFKTRLTCLGAIVPAAEKRRPRQLRSPTGKPLLPRGPHGFEHLR